MTRDQFISLCFIAILLFVLWQVFLIFSPFFRAIFWSAILAFGFYPLYQKFRKAVKTNEIVAASLMSLFIFLIVVPPVIFLILNLAGQAIELYQSASGYIQEGGLERLIERIRSWTLTQRIEARIVQWEPLKQSASEWILNSSKAIGNFAVDQAGTVTKNMFFLGLNILLMSILVFIFLKDGEKIYRFIYQVAPLEEKNKKPVFRQINDTFAAVIRGQLVTSFIQATVAGILYWILGVPLALFFAAATFLVALIPVAGAATVWLPLALYLFMIQEYAKAIILFVFGTLVISLIDNLVKPALIGEKTRLPYFLLFFGILGGLKTYGLMGIFLAPVILSLFFALVKIYQEKFLPARE